MNTIKDMEEIWIGLVEIVPLERSALGTGAFANALALAVSKHDFEAKVNQELVRLGYRLRDSEDVERLCDRIETSLVASDLLFLAEALSAANPVGIGDFYWHNE